MTVSLVRKLVNTLKNFELKRLFRTAMDFWRKYGESDAYYRGLMRYAYAERLAYDCEYQNDNDYSGFETDIKPIAFYLPKYRRITEDNKRRDEEFAGWENVKGAKLHFIAHYQPRIPHADIGYYDSGDVQTLRRQADLAKKHKIYGFCFYCCRASDKTLIDESLSNLLDNKDIDINFCICRVSGSWISEWNDEKKDAAMQRNYDAGEPEKFIIDTKSIIEDARYIRCDGKPVIIMHNPLEIPDPGRYFDSWREAARKHGIGEICIWVCRTAGENLQHPDIFGYIDAQIEFPPLNKHIGKFWLSGLFPIGSLASVYDYARVAEMMILKEFDGNEGLQNLEMQTSGKPAMTGNEPLLFKTCITGRDNSARYPYEWTVLQHFTLSSFYRWARYNAKYTREHLDEKNRFTFIYAWNGWDEGVYMEPDAKYGYACVNTFSKAVCSVPYDGGEIVIDDRGNSAKGKPLHGVVPPDRKIAVQIHLFYIDTIDEIISYVNNIPCKYDCYISTDTIDKKKIIEKEFKEKCSAENIFVEQFENRGRDVAPLLFQMKETIGNYDYFCHIHSKKTKNHDYGDSWRGHLFRHLLGSPQYINGLLEVLETEDNIGIVFPRLHPAVGGQNEWCENRKLCAGLLDKMGLSVEVSTDAVFPAGNMFWARTKAVEDIFKLGLSVRDFPDEKGQTDGTLAHAIERVWVYLARANGYEFCRVMNGAARES